MAAQPSVNFMVDPNIGTFDVEHVVRDSPLPVIGKVSYQGPFWVEFDDLTGVEGVTVGIEITELLANGELFFDSPNPLRRLKLFPDNTFQTE